MSYISLIIALIQTMSQGNIPPDAWLDVYLNNLVGVETWFFNASWWIFGIFLTIAVVFLVIGAIRKNLEFASAGIGCGCVTLFVLLLPLMEWWTKFLATGMASAVDPTGIVNTGKFWICLILYLLTGAG